MKKKNYFRKTSVTDLHSIDRSLSKRLYLIVKPKTTSSGSEGARDRWIFPECRREKGESMIHAAIRGLYEHVGKSLYVYPVSALPIAHYVAPLDRQDLGR